MIRIKPGVSLRKMQPQMTIALIVGERVFGDYGSDLTITSGDDGVHSPNSLHPKGLAQDWRIRDLKPGSVKFVFDKLREILAGQFDVVLEDDHMHVEFDPK